MINHFLDQTYEQTRQGISIETASEPLITFLRETRLGSDDVHWNEVVRPACESHPLKQIYLEDPHTRRAREKPRGYAGDAVMLDQLYYRVAPEDLTPLGKEVFAFTTASPAGQGVRWRMHYLADEIDRITALFGSSRILSLACGHLREAGRSKAVQSGAVEIFHAIDQDEESLAVVQRDYGFPNVRPQAGSLGGVLKGKLRFEPLHLAYAAGLYDYLDEAVAQALTSRLFAMLAPGGKAIVPNFLIDNHARGYMESFMDWHLVVRTRAQIEALGATVPASEIAETRYFEDPFGMVGYLELVKRA